MATPVRKPTRRDLLIVIERLQADIGRALAANNDRNPNRQAEVDGVLHEAHDLCVQARVFDAPIEHPRGPWAAPNGPRRHYL